MERESSHGVGAGLNGNSRAIKQTGEIHHLGERFSIGLVHTGGRSHAEGEQAAANLRGQPAGDGLESSGNLAGAAEVLVFEDAEGKVELGVVILQQLDEGLYLRRREVETGADLAGFDEARDGVGVLDVGKEIQDEEIHMLNFVV